jgi:putative ABC transport system permease protein
MIVEPKLPEYLESSDVSEGSGLEETWPKQVEKTQITVIGIIDAASESLIADFGNMLVSSNTLNQIFDDRFDEGEQFFMKSTHYLQLKDTSDQNALSVASNVESTLFGTGVQATSIAKLQADQTSQSQSFQILFEAFMGLGLLVGIAALGVISFRAVVERRQQIGMLRAIGFTRKMIAIAFFVEASFIAFIGIGLGIVLGIGLSYNLLSSPDALGSGGNEFSFYVPWFRVFWFLTLAYVAAMLMTLIPARKASKVAIAEALRYE